MNIYTVSFFGHREIENPTETEHRLEQLIQNLIKQKENIEFLIGREGEFDILASSVIRQVIAKHNWGYTVGVPLMIFKYSWLNNFYYIPIRKLNFVFCINRVIINAIKPKPKKFRLTTIKGEDSDKKVKVI